MRPRRNEKRTVAGRAGTSCGCGRCDGEGGDIGAGVEAPCGKRADARGAGEEQGGGPGRGGARRRGRVGASGFPESDDISRAVVWHAHDVREH